MSSEDLAVCASLQADRELNGHPMVESLDGPASPDNDDELETYILLMYGHNSLLVPIIERF